MNVKASERVARTIYKKTCILETEQRKSILLSKHQEPISLCTRRTYLVGDPELADMDTPQKSPGSRLLINLNWKYVTEINHCDI